MSILSKLLLDSYLIRRSFSLLAPRCGPVPFKVKNSMTGKLETVTPTHSPNLTWYCCGPTVYDSAHMGHAYTYVQFDIIRRILQQFGGYNVVFMMNITNIDDKIIQRAQAMKGQRQGSEALSTERSDQAKSDWLSVANKYEREFFDDMRSLGIMDPTIVADVTRHMPQIILFVEDLLKKGLAYVVDDGSVYFDAKAYGRGGKFRQTLDPSFMRPDEMSTKKRSPADFALWKGAKSNEPSWPVPFSPIPGRPGWHIECSTLASHFLGSKIDLHSGGMDLTFPHHENEEIQCCAFHDVDRWVSHWMHTGHVVLDDDTKMSKSLKNYVTIKDFLASDDPQAFRIFCMQHHYRSNCRFSEKSTKAAISTYARWMTFLNNADFYHLGVFDHLVGEIDDRAMFAKLTEVQERVSFHLFNDFDVPEAMQALSELVDQVYPIILNPERPKISRLDKAMPLSGAVPAVANYLNKFLLNLGVTMPIRANLFNMIVDAGGASDFGSVRSALDLDVAKLMDDVIRFRSAVRGEARRGKKARSRVNLLKYCDELRDNLLKTGISVKDHGNDCASWDYVKKTRKVNSVDYKKQLFIILTMIWAMLKTTTVLSVTTLLKLLLTRSRSKLALFQLN
ncbi:LOW QUALITY PROTEIN: probable cysteine--tRNA ligase, mitochondrial [Paramacrobiotus metropolitanus]|uniref:LOW QUALITY PROTEIN: probable cysteine--tRNA ligase, mitochondrial n=1 Tax=Paramacrobiotus metropolitanus TaxID=2943436 RepID=UPI002446114D|nr:LOW QUALITY PROTEIN: probable cysteine--tRNA ligase, mitochondrial [Paramacrobiotus metropolitanus]